MDWLVNVGKVFNPAIPGVVKVESKVAVPELKDGEFLMRVYYLSIDPIMRVWMTGAPTYLPPLKPG